VSEIDSGFHNNPAAPVLFTYRSVQVHVGPDGLIDAKDMHRAVGCPKTKAPRFWLRWQPAQQMVSRLREKGAGTHLFDGQIKSPNLEIYRVEPGRNGGTWLCRELAVAYAAYLDPDFYLFVIQVFLAVGDGKLVPVGAVPAEVQAELAKLEARAAAAEELLEELHARLSQATSHRRPDYHTRGLHALFVAQRLGRMCHCCNGRPITQTGPRPRLLPIAAVNHWFCESRAGLRETWAVCRRCNLDIRRCPEFRQTAEPRFRDYQSRLGQWLIESQGRLPL
jgi:hypothetical protein